MPDNTLGDLRPLLTPAAMVKIERPRWLHENLVPLQVLSLLTGIAGEGKSTLALDWGAKITRGTLPGEFYGRPANILISATEDAKGLQLARLNAAGADLDRVTFLDMATIVAGDTIEQPIVFPRDAEVVRDSIISTGACLWIIDPVTGIIPGDSNSRDAVRHALDPLHALARDLDIAVLGIAHFNKGGGRSKDKISGSHAFRDVARAHIPLVVDEESGHRVYTLEKSNYSTEVGHSWQFDLADTEVTTTDGEVMHVARVIDLGESDVTVDQVINRGMDDGDEQDRNDAQAFLLDYLADNGGEVSAGDALKAGRAAGFSDSDLKNARKRMRNPKVESRKAGGKGVGWVWAVELDPASDTFENPAVPSQKQSVEEVKGVKVSPSRGSDTFALEDPSMPRDSNEKSKVSPLTPSTPPFGTVVGTHDVWGPVLYSKAGYVPANLAQYQEWKQTGSPDLSKVGAA